MAREHIHAQPLPPNPRPAHALLHEDLPVKVPEAAAEGERSELDLLDGVPRQDGEARALQGQEVPRAAGVEALEVGDVGDGAPDCLVVGAVPDFLEQDYVVVGEGDDVLEGPEAGRPVLGPGPAQTPGVEIEDFEDLFHCKPRNKEKEVELRSELTQFLACQIKCRMS